MHNIINLIKTKDKKKFLKASREKPNIDRGVKQLKQLKTFLLKLCKPEDSGPEFLKCWKKNKSLNSEIFSLQKYSSIIKAKETHFLDSKKQGKLSIADLQDKRW